MIDIRLIDKDHQDDIRLKNQPFDLVGRLIPSYQDESWSYSIDYWPETSQMCFPDEDYDFEALSENHVFLGAYEGETCIGLAVLQEAWFKYFYLYDLKVDPAYRRQGVGQALIQASVQLAIEKGYEGLYTQAQDNNLLACLSYLKAGFVIGGFDNHIYKSTAQEGKADIIFYLDKQ